MRVEGSVTAISWIPSEAIEGLPKLPFELGVGHYDEPPPDPTESSEGTSSRTRSHCSPSMVLRVSEDKGPDVRA
jgi:hypothetical protein